MRIDLLCHCVTTHLEIVDVRAEWSVCETDPDVGGLFEK